MVSARFDRRGMVSFSRCASRGCDGAKVMKAYLDLLRDVRERGVRKPTRAVLRSTGEKIDALSLFGAQIRFDLAAGFPAVTTKKLAFGPVVHELIWFLKGSTNIAYLKAHGV